MSTAITLRSAGDQFFQTREYPQAIEQYRASLKIDLNQADVWFKKGLAHKIQSQFSKALFAFSKAGEIDERFSNTFAERSLLISLRDPSANPSQYFSEVYSPLICKPEYLLELKQFQESLPKMRGKPFEDQLKQVILLLQFLQKYLVLTGDSYPFVREVLSQIDDKGRKRRLAAIGLTVLKFLPKTVVSFPRNWLKDEMDPAFIDVLKTAQEDIYLEDSKKVWRMIFEIIYFFPREKRGEYVGKGKNNILPWGDQSWYLLDFCGAVMGSDETIERLKKNKGIYCVPYQYYDDNKTWQQSYFFQALVNHCLVTKMACRDLIQEAQPMQDFFTQLLNRDRNAKLKPLPHLNALIRYSKQLFNTQKRSEGWNNEHFKKWTPFIKDYWASVQNYYTSNDEKTEYIPNECLLSQPEISNLLVWMGLSKHDPFCDVLEGKKTWPGVIPPITVSDNKREADKLVKNAKNTYATKRNKSQEDDRKKKIQDAMNDNFPNMEALKTALKSTPKQPYTSCEIFKVLRNRFEVLKQLFQEQSLPSDKLSKDPLLIALETDTNFLLSSTYLLEQIFELLNTNLVRLHLESMKIPIEADLPRYFALRNHLAHSDPIYESIEFPYYEMHSNASKLMAAVFVELNQVYEPVVINYRPEALSSVDLAAIESLPAREKVKQAEALDPVLF